MLLVASFQEWLFSRLGSGVVLARFEAALSDVMVNEPVEYFLLQDIPLTDDSHSCWLQTSSGSLFFLKAAVAAAPSCSPGPVVAGATLGLALFIYQICTLDNV